MMTEEISSESSNVNSNVEELTIVDVDANFRGTSSTEKSTGRKPSPEQPQQQERQNDEAQLPKATELQSDLQSYAAILLDCDSSESEAELDQQNIVIDVREDSSHGCHVETDGCLKTTELLKNRPTSVSRRILLSTKFGRFSEANELLMQTPEDLGELSVDKSRRTAAHYAAMRPDGESTLQKILQRYGFQALLKQDYKLVTPLHLSLGCHSTDAVRNILTNMETAGERVSNLLKTLKTSRRNTIAHYAALNTKHQDVLNLLIDSTPTNCNELFAPNSAGQTMLHTSIENVNLERIIALIEIGHNRSGCLGKHLSTRNQLGNSCIHYAAMRGANEAVLRAAEYIPKSSRWKNNKKQSVLQLVLQNCSEETIKRLLKLSSELPLTPDDAQKFGQLDCDGNTWMHFAAMNKDNDSAIFAALEDAERQAKNRAMSRDSMMAVLKNLRCPCWLNYKSETVLHLASMHCKPSVVEQLLKATNSKCVSLQDSSGNTCMHYMAIRTDCSAPLLAALSISGSDGLEKQNRLGQTLLHCLVHKENETTLLELLPMASVSVLKAADDAGNTVVHLAVARGMVTITDVILKKLTTDCLLWRNNKQQTAIHLAFANLESHSLLTKVVPSEIKTLKFLDATGRNPLFYASFNWNIKALIPFNSSDEITRVDTDGNTLMHALFMNTSENSNACDFIRSLEILAKAGVNPDTENEIGKTCLQVCEIQENLLLQILKEAADKDDVGKLIKRMLCSSTGTHAIHIASTRYCLDNLVELFSHLSGIDASQLLALRVLSGPYSGATCLHFACQAGHESNIKFLVRMGLSLSSPTQDGLSPIDFAYHSGKDSAVKKAFLNNGARKTNLLRMLDIPKRALDLPNRETANKILNSLSVSVQGNKSHQRTLSGVNLLVTAIELDAPEILRCALSLGLISLETEFSAASILNPDNTKATEMTIVETAMHLNKFKIIPDLVLTRQFELIPTCLKMLVDLRRKLRQIPEQREQLKELKQKLKCIAFNSLDEMFCNANEYEQQLLFDYICGRMMPENKGPLFTCVHMLRGMFGDQKKDVNEPCTLLRLLLESGCNELLVSECMTKLADNEWKNRHCSLTRDLLPNDENVKKNVWIIRLERYPVASPRAKFFSHSISDAAVLILLTLMSLGIPLADGSSVLYSVWMYTFIVYGISTYIKLFLRILSRSSLPFSSTNRAFSWLEVFNAAAIVFGLAGVIAYDFYVLRMFTASCFLVWGLRLVSFLAFFEKTGPMVIMLVQLLFLDLLPFLSVILIVIYSFGIFFLHLLFPVPAKPDIWRAFVQVITLPMKLMFTNFDHIQFNTVPTTNLTGHPIGSMAYDQGSYAFYDVFMFVFLLLVNIVMVNLLIALFSLRVSKIASKSKIVWRRMYFDMLVECNRMSVIPSPIYLIFASLNVLHGVYLAFQGYSKQRLGNCGNSSNWWHSESDYPKEYVQFLQFQARQFRRFGRQNFTRRIVDANADPDGVQAHTDNKFVAVQRGIDSLARMQAAVSKQTYSTQIETQLTNLKTQSKRRRKQISQLETKMDRVLEILQKR